MGELWGSVEVGSNRPATSDSNDKLEFEINCTCILFDLFLLFSLSEIIVIQIVLCIIVPGLMNKEPPPSLQPAYCPAVSFSEHHHVSKFLDAIQCEDQRRRNRGGGGGGGGAEGALAPPIL